MRDIRKLLFITWVATVTPVIIQARDKLPNIVIFFMDDMGYGDLTVTGASGYNTPTIDRLASEGMFFTHFYAAQPISSASRAGLITGCYPNRVGISGALMPQVRIGVAPNEETLPEMLKTRGYSCGMVGKWHLGHLYPFLPLQQGFDEYLGLPYSNDMWPVDYDGNRVTPASNLPNKLRHPALPLIDGNEKIRELWTLDDQAELTTLYPVFKAFSIYSIKFVLSLSRRAVLPFLVSFSQFIKQASPALNPLVITSHNNLVDAPYMYRSIFSLLCSLDATCSACCIQQI